MSILMQNNNAQQNIDKTKFQRLLQLKFASYKCNPQGISKIHDNNTMGKCDVLLHQRLIV